MRFKNNCSSSEAPAPERGNQCFSAGIQWPTRAAEAVKGTSKRRSGNSWRKKISRVNRKKTIPSHSSCQNPGSADPDQSCSEGRWGEVHQSGRGARRNWLKEQSFKEISEKDEPRKELADLWHHWEAKAQRWIHREEELEDTLQDKIQTICRRVENKNQEEIQLKIIQIQLWTYGCHRLEWVERFFYNFMFG